MNFTLIALVFSLIVALVAVGITHIGRKHRKPAPQFAPITYRWTEADSQAALAAYNDYMESQIELARYNAACDTSEFNRTLPPKHYHMPTEEEVEELETMLMGLEWECGGNDALMTHALDQLL